MDGAHDVLDDALVAQVERRVGRDAVLRVDDVEARRRRAAAAGPRGRRRPSPRMRSSKAASGRHVLDEMRVDRRRAEEALAGLGERAARRPRARGPASASATASACSTPPRGLTEYVSIAIFMPRTSRGRDRPQRRRVAAALDGATIAPASRRICVWRAASCGSPSVPQTRASTTAFFADRGDRLRQAGRRVAVRRRGRARRRAARSRRRRRSPPPRGSRAARRGRPSGAGAPACTPPRRGRARRGRRRARRGRGRRCPPAGRARARAA